MELVVNKKRLNERMMAMAKLGARPDGGVCRMAVSDEDKLGRDQIVAWMKELGMKTFIDEVGNLIGIRDGKTELAPIMIGSHIDTVPTGGRYDGTLGVVAGLEVVESLNDAGIETERPIMLVAFTNEEGARYRVDMLGSRAFCGFLTPGEAYNITGIDGTKFGEELKRIGYVGSYPCGVVKPHAYIELHIEQGPVLSREQLKVGIVNAITGISWHELTIRGEANHAGTTPIYMRKDAGLSAAKIICDLRVAANTIGPDHRATCGMISFSPNAINVIPSEAVMSIDLRDWDEAKLHKSDEMLKASIERISKEDNTMIESKPLAWVKPELCEHELMDAIEDSVNSFKYSYTKMVSGAVHDALIMAKYCPTAMIFVPSKDGISHNPTEYTSPDECAVGANVLLRTIHRLADGK